MKINQLKAGAILSYFSMGIGYIISIIYTPIMLRLLGQSEYGLYNLVASIVAYLGLLNFGFGSSYIRYFSRYKVKDDKESLAKLNGMFLIIFSALGMLAILAGIVLALNSAELLGSQLTTSELNKARILMLIMVFNIAITFPLVVFNSYVTANEKFIYQRLLGIITSIINPFLVLPLLFTGYGSVGMVLVTTTLNLLVAIINITYCFRVLKIEFNFTKFDRKLMKEISQYSSFIFINMIVDQINWNVDKFIVGRMYGTVSVALYGLASQLNTYYISLSTSVSSVFIPRIHQIVEKMKDNLEITNLFTRVGRIQFIILSLIASILIFFGRPFIHMWAGSNYDSSYFMALILIIPVTIPLIQNLGIEIQRAKNLHKFRSWLYLLIAIANVGISIPLTQWLGPIGAALGTGISLLIGNGIIMNWYYQRYVGLNMQYYWGQIVVFIPSLILPAIVGVLINRLIDLYHLSTFLVGGFAYMIVFSFSMWFFGMNQYERELIGNPLNRLFRKLRLK